MTGPYQDRELHSVMRATVHCPECAEGAVRVAHTCMAALKPDRVEAQVKERLHALNIHR